MSDADSLEKRLEDALYRIEAAVGALPDPAEAMRNQAEMEGLLEAERETNAELIQRVKALKERQETHVAALEAKLAEARTAAGDASRAQAALKETIEELRRQIARLTEANRSMVGDPELVNTSMMAELEAMRATRRADAGEIDAILAILSEQSAGQAHA